MSMDKMIEKKKWSPKTIAAVSGIGIAAVCVFCLILFSDATTKLNVKADTITVSDVRRAPFQELITVSGTIEPYQTVFLDLTEGGRIVARYVEEGAFVKAGQALLKMDNPNLSLQVMSTQSNFMLAESQLRQTRLTFEQNRLSKESQLLDIEMRLADQKRKFDVSTALFDKKLIARNEFESTRDQYEALVKNRDLMREMLQKDSLTNLQLVEQSETNVARSKAYLQLIESQLAQLTVKAPISGQLTAFEAEIGQTLTPGHKLGRIDNTDAFKIKAEVDEHYIARVRQNLTGTCEFNGRTYGVRIVTVFPQVANGRFMVDLAFTGTPPEGIRRGQTVHIMLELGGVSDAVQIDAGAFFASTGGHWIYVVDPSGQSAQKRTITLGRQNPQSYEVLDGLRPGEKVVTSSYEHFDTIDKLIFN